jgi:hypothetical protein
MKATLFSKVLAANSMLPIIKASVFILTFCFGSAYSQLFIPTDSMANQRNQHEATLLLNGEILVMGGHDGYNEYINSCELYDPATATCRATGSMLSRRYDFAAIRLLNGKVLVTGGINDTYGRLDSCEIYNPITETWSATGSMYAKRYYHTLTLLPDGKVLAVGSNPGDGFEEICEIYDPGTGTWSLTGSLSEGRYLHTATLLQNGKVLVASGHSVNDPYTKSCELYDPSAGTWSNTGSLAIGRYYAEAVILLNGHLLITGGGGYQGHLKSTEIYNSSTGTWSITDSLATGRLVHSLTRLPNGKVITIGGRGWSGILRSCEIYDPMTSMWSYADSLTTFREAHTATLFSNGKILVTAGGGISDVERSCEFYENGCGVDLPFESNILNSNTTIRTQTQMDNFYNNVSGINYGRQWTKINGSLVIDGGSYTDPITSLCNLSSLTEITGSLLITNFNKSGNPTDLNSLSALSAIGCHLNLISNLQLNNMSLPNLITIGCAATIKDNNGLTTLNIPQLKSIKGDKLIIKNNPKLEILSLSTLANSFTFLGKGSGVEISENGKMAANPLTMNLKKITEIKGTLTFSNNDNAGVTNFDNIFSGLISLSSSWGKLIITDNDYLKSCCIAASVIVGGSGKRHLISGNIENCLDSTVVLANCGVFHKKTSINGIPRLQDISFSVYPNPTQGPITLEVNSPESVTFHIVITDMVGKVLFDQKQDVKTFMKIPISFQVDPHGQYIIKVEHPGQVFVQRVIISN